MIKRILVGLGGTPFTESEIRHSIELAIAHQAELTGVTIVDLARVSDVGPVPLGGEAAAASLRSSRLEQVESAVHRSIEQFHTACAAAGLRHRVIREEGRPFSQLKSLRRYHDLTVIGLQGLFGYGVMLDPKDQITRLLAEGVRPILGVGRQFRSIERVLIAYNGSVEAAEAMQQFAQLGLWPQASVRIACFEMREDEAVTLLRDAREYLRLWGFDAETTHTAEKPEHALLQQANQWPADMIVLGSTARARILKFVMGDTAHHLITHAEMPLFLSQ